MPVSARRTTDGRRRAAGRTPTGEDEPRSAPSAHDPAMGSGRRDRGRTPVTEHARPTSGLVVAAAMAPGTFAPSLSPRSALDQGLVTGLATGLHYLLAAGAQDALVATARFLADGTPSPAARRTGHDRGRRRRGAARARRAPGPPAARRRPAAGRRPPGGLAARRHRASAARCSAAPELGAQALDDRLRLGGRLAAVPLARPRRPRRRLRRGPAPRRRARRAHRRRGRRAAAVVPRRRDGSRRLPRRRRLRRARPRRPRRPPAGRGAARAARALAAGRPRRLPRRAGARRLRGLAPGDAADRGR